MRIAEWAVSPLRNAEGVRHSRDHASFLDRMFGGAPSPHDSLCRQAQEGRGFVPHLLHLAIELDLTSALWLCRRWPAQVCRERELVHQVAQLACRRPDSWRQYQFADGAALERLVNVLDLLHQHAGDSGDIDLLQLIREEGSKPGQDAHAHLYYCHFARVCLCAMRRAANG
jgi:hypothetical protein